MKKYGNEYFKGDYLQMKKDINKIIDDNDNLSFYDILNIKQNEINLKNAEKLRIAEEKAKEKKEEVSKLEKPTNAEIQTRLVALEKTQTEFLV